MKNFLEKVQRKGPEAENDKTERVTGLSRRTREEIAKWNQMTALRSRQGGDIRNPRPLFGGLIKIQLKFIIVHLCLNIRYARL